MFSLDDTDPMAAALAPPQNESPQERQLRIMRERAAKQISDDIDEELTRERQQAKRLPKPVKILLLGAWLQFCRQVTTEVGEYRPK